MKKFFTLVAALLPLMGVTAQNWEGAGTAADPYRIASTDDMQALAEEVNSGNSYAGTYFSLEGDVSSSMIGADGASFMGTFDGNNHTVTLDLTSGGEYIGLFGYVENATIREVKVAGQLTGHDDIGYEGFGGVVGYAKNSLIENCENSATLSCYNKYNGGICGYSENSTIQYCTNSGAVMAMSDNQDRSGGICGTNDGGTIIGCTNTGSVSGDDGVGGIAGRHENGATTRSCVNSGAVKGDLFVGGIVGELYENPSLRAATADIVYCYNSGAVTGNESVGGIAGDLENNAITASYNVGQVTGTTSVGGIAGNPNTSVITDCAYLTGTLHGAEEDANAQDAAALAKEMATVFTSENGWASAPELALNGTFSDPTVAVSSSEEPEKPTAIEVVEGVKVYAMNGSLYVQTPQPMKVMVVSLTGSIVKEGTLAGTQSYSLSRGIYIVKVGEQCFKVRI